MNINYNFDLNPKEFIRYFNVIKINALFIYQ